MYIVKPTTKFQKDLKRVQRRGYDIDLLLMSLKNLPPAKRWVPYTTITR
jgi:mRNA interferase YafQ